MQGGLWWQSTVVGPTPPGWLWGHIGEGPCLSLRRLGADGDLRGEGGGGD